MDFEQKTWQDGSGGGTPIDAANLNRIEQGVEDAEQAVEAAQTDADAAEAAAAAAQAAATGKYTKPGGGIPSTDLTPSVQASLATAAAVFDVHRYGAVGDGVTDDTTAIQNAINACQTAGGGFVVFRPLTYLVTPTANPALSVTSSRVLLVGSGRGVTRLKKSANGIILSIHGADQNTVIHDCGVRDLVFNGNDKTGAQLRLYYASSLQFDRVMFEANADICVDIVQLWDTRFYDCIWDYNGARTADTYTPNVNIRNSAAASGFGASTDNSNQIYFIACRWESFLNGALYIGQGVSNTNAPNGIHLLACKMESNLILGGPAIKTDNGCSDIHIHRLYMWLGGFYAGYSTAITAILFVAAFSSLRDILIGNGGTVTLSRGVDCYATNSRLDNIIGNYGSTPTGTNNAHVRIQPGATGCDTSLIRSTLGTALSLGAGVDFALPASGATWTNNTTQDVTLHVTAAGTVTNVTVNGTTVASSLTVGQTFRIPRGGTFVATYSAAPTFAAVRG